MLRAPRGKQLVWFELAHHPLHLEEPTRFRAELRRVLAETDVSGGVGKQEEQPGGGERHHHGDEHGHAGTAGNDA